MSHQAVWQVRFGRNPVDCAITQPNNFIRSDAASKEAIKNIFKPANAIDNTFIFGIDSEFVNDRIQNMYTNWGTDRFMLDGEPTHSDYSGPFTRFFQLATITGDIYIWDFAYFSHPPPGLHELLTIDGKNKYKLFMHDASNDDLAYYRMYMPRKFSFIKFNTMNLKPHRCFHPNNIIDTKNLYENYNHIFNAKGYYPPGNRLSDHVNYSFDIALDKSIKTYAQSWSRPLTQTMIEYLARDAVSVLDIGLLWMRLKLVRGHYKVVLPRLLHDENFLLDNLTSNRVSTGGGGAIPLSKTVVDKNVALARVNARKARDRARKKERLGHYYASSDSDFDGNDYVTDDIDDDPFSYISYAKPGTTMYITHAQNLAEQQPSTSHKVSTNLSIQPLTPSINLHRYCIAPKSIPVPKPSILPSSVFLSTPSLLTTHTSVIPIINIDIDDQANATSSAASVQIASTRATDVILQEILNNIAFQSDHIVSREAINYYSTVLNTSHINSLFQYISRNRDNMYNDVIMFHENILKQPGPDPQLPTSAPLSMSDILNRSSETACNAQFIRPFSNKSHFSCFPYAGKTDKEISLSVQRLFVTSSRTLFEIPKDRIGKEFTLYPIPGEIVNRNRCNITQVPNPIFDCFGMEPAIALSLENVQIIFDVASMFCEDYKKLYSYIPGYNITNSSCKEFIFASFYKFRAKNSCSHISFLMMEQLRRLLSSLLNAQAFHPRWAELARFVDLEVKWDNPKAFHEHLLNIGSSILTGGRNLVLDKRARSTVRRARHFANLSSSVGPGNVKRQRHLASDQPGTSKRPIATPSQIPIVRPSRELSRTTGHAPVSFINRGTLRSVGSGNQTVSSAPPIIQPPMTLFAAPTSIPVIAQRPMFLQPTTQLTHYQQPPPNFTYPPNFNFSPFHCQYCPITYPHSHQ